MVGRRRPPDVGGVVCCWCAVLCCALLLRPGHAAAVTAAELAARYEQAIRQVEAARDEGTPLGDPAPLFPERETVGAGGGTLQADYASLRAEWRAVPAGGDARRQALDRLGTRLQAVRAELSVAEAPAAAATDHPTPPDWRERLTTILQSPEFKKREAQESLLEQFLKWLLDKLGSLFPAGAAQAVGSVARWVVYALAGLALLALLTLLLRVVWPFLQRERKGIAQTAAEKPAADSPETLLALAETRRRAGDLRGAIQALFRWLLVTMHRAGRLEYDPALTNREHVARLKADGKTRAAFAELAVAFEMAWYAQRPVSPESYGAFRSRCASLGGNRP